LNKDIVDLRNEIERLKREGTSRTEQDRSNLYVLQGQLTKLKNELRDEA
jgi:hypothetical protein